MSFLKRLFGGKAAPAFDTPLAPDSAVFVIGDIHGCDQLMTQLIAQMEGRDVSAVRVFVGDYVDRGEGSATVLRTLYEMRDNPQIVCLIGNHEDMMLGFLDAPEKKGERWLRYGGLQTLASFGIGGVTASSTGEDLRKASEALKTAMGDDLLAWLRALPTSWHSGNLSVVHAGADPITPLSLQSGRTFMWGHPDFDHVLRTDGTWVAHGHTVVEEANSAGGKIAVDTGAYATGRLTAAYINEGAVSFLQTG